MAKFIAVVALSAVLLAFVPFAQAGPENRGGPDRAAEDLAGSSTGVTYVPAQQAAPVLISPQREGENQLAGI